jgi:predicted RNase H-like HicB family nuclease
MDKYEIIIYWSADDGAFIAEVPELPGCMAHGPSHEAALGNIKTAIELWIKTAKEFNDPTAATKGPKTCLCMKVFVRLLLQTRFFRRGEFIGLDLVAELGLF